MYSVVDHINRVEYVGNEVFPLERAVASFPLYPLRLGLPHVGRRLTVGHGGCCVNGGRGWRQIGGDVVVGLELEGGEREGETIVPQTRGGLAVEPHA